MSPSDCAHETVAELESLISPLAAHLNSRGRAIVVAAPGAGKTTRLPLGLLAAMDDGELAPSGTILMLEPRRVATVAAATMMAQRLGESVGNTVGYQIRGERNIGNHTRIEVITERLLSLRLHRDPELTGVAMVIFDEVHERSLASDVAIALCLDAAHGLRDDLAIVAMSATPDIAPLQQAFSSHGAPVRCFEVEGAPHPVTTTYLGRDHRRRIEDEVTDAVLGALRTVASGDVLVFLPGRGEIRRAERHLRNRGIEPISIWGGTDAVGTSAVLGPHHSQTRRVILATAVAQSAITIDGVRVVIDSGLERLNVVHPRSGVESLVTLNASKATVDQRRGRSGRQGPGTCFRLWDERDQHGRRDQTPAEIERVDLGGLALDLAHWGTTDLEDLVWLQPPDPARYQAARQSLMDLGLVAPNGRATTTGAAVLRTGLTPQLGALLITGQRFGHGELAANVAIALEAQIPGDLFNAVRSLDNVQLRMAQRALSAVAADKRSDDVTAGPASAGEAENAVAVMMAETFPGAVARRRNSTSRYLRADGVEVAAGRSWANDTPEWVVIGSMMTAPDSTTIAVSAIALREPALSRVLDRAQTRAQLDQTGPGMFRARRVASLGAIVLSDQPGEVSADEMLAACLQEISDTGTVPLGWDEAQRCLQRRTAFARQIDQSVSDLSDEAIARGAPHWLAPRISTALRGSRLDLTRIPAGPVLDQLLDWRSRQRIDELAPPTVQVPSGRQVRVDYGPHGPTLEVKLQEMFGAVETPSVANGTVPITLHLLSPAGRPLQVTSDLRGFWQGSYRDVRAEMRGRYPKHPWPEDPMSAPATAKVKHPRRR